LLVQATTPKKKCSKHLNFEGPGGDAGVAFLKRYRAITPDWFPGKQRPKQT